MIRACREVLAQFGKGLILDLGRGTMPITAPVVPVAAGDRLFLPAGPRGLRPLGGGGRYRLIDLVIPALRGSIGGCLGLFLDLGGQDAGGKIPREIGGIGDLFHD